MKFTCEKRCWSPALSVASRTVTEDTIPCLEGVLLRAGVALQLTGYNLETGITVHVGAQIQEAGSCVMPARLFFDIVRKLPDEMVSITVDHKQQVSIRAGAAFFQITAMDRGLSRAAGRQRQERRDHAAVRAEGHDLRHNLLRVRKSGPPHPDRLPDGGHGGFRHHGRRGQLGWPAAPGTRKTPRTIP